MSLTFKVEKRLIDADLVTFFEKGEKKASKWHKVAKETFDFVQKHFPNGATIRPDDVAVALIPLLEVEEELGAFLQENKLQQQYWYRYFADLIVDRCWPSIKAKGG
jgi:hypothetical protein